MRPWREQRIGRGWGRGVLIHDGGHGVRLPTLNRLRTSSKYGVLESPAVDEKFIRGRWDVNQRG